MSEPVYEPVFTRVPGSFGSGGYCRHEEMENRLVEYINAKTETRQKEEIVYKPVASDLRGIPRSVSESIRAMETQLVEYINAKTETLPKKHCVLSEMNEKLDRIEKLLDSISRERSDGSIKSYLAAMKKV